MTSDHVDSSVEVYISLSDLNELTWHCSHFLKCGGDIRTGCEQDLSMNIVTCGRCTNGYRYL